MIASLLSTPFLERTTISAYFPNDSSHVAGCVYFEVLKSALKSLFFLY
jgi:hypothetical protein